jgi:NAD(P)H-dependent FMN reductase
LLNYTIISGSHRSKSQSTKVSLAVESLLKRTKDVGIVDLIDLRENPLPFWDESIWSKDPKWDKTWKPLSEKLRRSDGVVIVSPEWHGMAPSGLKNFLLFCTNQDLGHKPGLLITVSSGLGGSYPVAELRMSGYKNNRLCFIPDHVIIRQVEKVLNNIEKPESPDDERILRRLQYSIGVFREYSVALKEVRKSSAIDFTKEFATGM